jgi:multidrug efflux pump subunit AcrA (membrane-fusion protein)
LRFLEIKESEMKNWKWIVVSVLSLLALAACSLPAGPGASDKGAQTPEGEVLPVVSRDKAYAIIAEGEIQPARSRELGFEIPGTVTEVLVKEGDRVAAGTLLARLDTREMELALRSAEQDVAAQQAALDRLVKGATEEVIRRADKGNADQIAQAEVGLRAKELQLEQARAEDPSIAVAAAEARIEQLERSLTQMQANDPAPSVAAAQVGVERARIALDDTQDEYNKALDRPWEDQEIRDAWSKRLEQAQLDYRAAQAQLNSALNSRRAHQEGLSVMEAQIEEAQTQLSQAQVTQESYATTLDILAADVDAARLNLEALRTWDNPYRDAATAEEVAQAEAGLEKTRIALENLQLQMEDAALLAPFAGTVVEVPVHPGDEVTPAQVALALATLDDLEVRTTDLTELDVAQIEVGQPVAVSVDALPDREFPGTVSEIALQGKDYRGDVVYEVTVALDESDQEAPLRWGMTTMVEIDTR